jgi:hypothetical protein
MSFPKSGFSTIVSPELTKIKALATNALPKSGGTLTGPLIAQAITTNGLITANAGVTVPSGQVTTTPTLAITNGTQTLNATVNGSTQLVLTGGITTTFSNSSFGTTTVSMKNIILGNNGNITLPASISIPTTGQLGYIAQTLPASMTNTALVTATSTNLTGSGLTLTQGVWSVTASFGVACTGAATTVTTLYFSISAVSGTLGQTIYTGTNWPFITGEQRNIVMSDIFNITATTTLYIVGQVTFSASSFSMYPGYSIFKAVRIA